MADASIRTIEVVPTGGPLAADIRGIDLSRPIDDATFRAVYRAWNDHLVLRFRGQRLDDDQLAAFSGRFGQLDKAPISAKDGPLVRHRDDVAVISNIVVDGQPIGGLGNSELVWHQDMSYNDLPPKASLLYGVETPSRGGETFFYNLYRAYETLPERTRQRIKGLSCKHDATRNSSGQLRRGYEEHYSNEARPGAIHPLVVRHPETGKPSLYLGRRPNAWVVGLSDAESDALLDELWAHVQNGPFHWAQEWQQGDLVIWDNRCTLHRRNTLDPSLRRLMHRTQVRDNARPIAA
ncbi:MAG: TauD/TfdA family dioxygenase [Hyphomicrobiaceae bacterium]|nr:TauD/TfdA family dioxygenase [Hyphomicrobiaceae bacterium]